MTYPPPTSTAGENDSHHLVIFITSYYVTTFCIHVLTSPTITLVYFDSSRCDWSQLSSPADLTLPTCEKGIICEGHNAADLINFTDFMGQGESYTNQAFLSFTHPWNDDLPYIYDTFDFDYCADVGYAFSPYKTLDEVTAATSVHNAPPGKSTTTSATGAAPAGGAAGGGAAAKPVPQQGTGNGHR